MYRAGSPWTESPSRPAVQVATDRASVVAPGSEPDGYYNSTPYSSPVQAILSPRAQANSLQNVGYIVRKHTTDTRGLFLKTHGCWTAWEPHADTFGIASDARYLRLSLACSHRDRASLGAFDGRPAIDRFACVGA